MYTILRHFELNFDGTGRVETANDNVYYTPYLDPQLTQPSPGGRGDDGVGEFFAIRVDCSQQAALVNTIP